MKFDLAARNMAVTCCVVILTPCILIRPSLASSGRSLIFNPEIHLAWDSQATEPDGIDQKSFLNALQGAGLQVRKDEIDSFSISSTTRPDLIVVPSASAGKLRPVQIQLLVDAVADGAALITDTDSVLSRRLGIRTGSGSLVGRVAASCCADRPLNWADRPSVPAIVSPSSATVLYRDLDSNLSVAIQFKFQKGVVVYFSPQFDPHSGYGYGRFPDLADILLGLGIKSPLSRNALDVYFDPGYRWAEDPEKLADQWSRSGIRAVHAAAWDMYAKTPYDFSSLVAAVHRHGMLIYAWLEWPYVGMEFWRKHPEWREKNGEQGDAVLSFLYLMNFQNRDCRLAATRELKALLRRVDFDGIDMAEFSITGGVAQSLDGPGNPKNFAGLNDDARREFKQRSGVDPIDLFSESSQNHWRRNPKLLNSFYAYRRETTRRLSGLILSDFSDFNKKIGNRLELMITELDNSTHPEFDQLLAIDMPSNIADAHKFNLVLQMEDAGSDWSGSPDRYRRMGELYAPQLSPLPLSIDINIVDNHLEDQVGYASSKPTGSELHWLYRSAASHASRVCFYSEFEIYRKDWNTLPMAMVADATLSRDGDIWNVDSPHSSYLSVQEDRAVTVDGVSWPARDGNAVLLPRGRHVVAEDLSAPSEAKKTVTLLSTTGDLVACRRLKNSLEVDVESDRGCIVRMKGAFKKVYVDLKRGVPTLSDDGTWFLSTPAGRHRIAVMSRAGERGDQ